MEPFEADFHYLLIFRAILAKSFLANEKRNQATPRLPASTIYFPKTVGFFFLLSAVVAETWKELKDLKRNV